MTFYKMFTVMICTAMMIAIGVGLGLLSIHVAVYYGAIYGIAVGMVSVIIFAGLFAATSHYVQKPD